ncbi:translocation protein TolB [Bacillus sp. THAF10]|uniref:TolB family protein n=1 Tax=Bacillus sp. THAF10 TaxID=2587848 RepID=UPI001268661A|nr:hypothetical protein [Bacillus sp. THAF10]QFT89816.1 translocation protein TolB [Bacillus sp. THAF10]
MKKQTLKLFTVALIAFVIIISVLLYFFSERFTRSWMPIDNGFGETVTLSPDDQSIVFPFYQSGDGALYKANVDGSNVNQLTYPRQAESHIHPRYSKNGEKILFLSQEKEEDTMKQSLYVMDAEGSNLQRLSENDELVTDAIFSPDSNTIFYLVAQQYQEGNDFLSGPSDMDVFSVSISGENKRQLTTDNSKQKRSLSITEDGSLLGYIDFPQDTDNQIASTYVLYNMETKEQKELIPRLDSPSPIFYSAKLSLNGKQIVFSAGSENPRDDSQLIYEMYTMDDNGKNVQAITSFRTLITEPVFFHKKERVLFIQDQGWLRGKPNFKLWAVDTNGERIESITLQMPQFSGTIL